MKSGGSDGCSSCKTDTAGSAIDFVFAYQPIVDLRRRTVFGHEALARGPDGSSAWSVLSQVNDDNRYQFDQACRARAIEGAARLGMAENLSINFMPNAVQNTEACIQRSLKAARQCGFPISKIIFEVTEYEQVRDVPHLVSIFRHYRKLGLRTAIDDFGAGYSGLNLLAHFQPDIVKIDMALVRGVEADRAKRIIVEGIVETCGRLGVQVLAEGVETAAERDFLRGAGIDLMQGFLFCEPAFQALGAVDPMSWPELYA